MNVMAIDAATTSGWALVSQEAGAPVLRSYGVIRADAVPIRELVEHMAPYPVDVVAIESPYVDKDPSVTIKLAVIAGRFAQEFDRAGVPHEMVKAAQWQGQLLTGLIAAGSARAVRKAAARRWVLSVYKRAVGEDEADAICMATWLAKTRSFAARAARSAS